MDIGTIVVFITPFLPSLISLGSKVVDGALEEVGSDAWNKAKVLWSSLTPKFNPATQEAAADLANNPNDADLQAAFRVQLKKLLSNNPDLVQTLATILEQPGAGDTSSTQIMQSAIGSQNQVIGQNYGTAIANIQGNVTLEPNPVIEAYKKDIDRTLIRENLKLSPEQRFLKLIELQRFAEELRRAGQNIRH